MPADLVFWVRLELRPECVEEWKAAVIDVIEQMSREQAFVSCSIQQDAEDPNCFTLYERWREPSVETFLKNQFEGKGTGRRTRPGSRACFAHLVRPRSFATCRSGGGPTERGIDSSRDESGLELVPGRGRRALPRHDDARLKAA